jgi:hypothetical protein
MENRSMKLLAPVAFLALAACASAGTPAAGGAPETVVIALPPDAVGTGSRPVLLPLHRDERGSRATRAAPLDQVWAVLPAVYDQLGIAVATLDARTHRIGNTALVAHRRLAGQRVSAFLECGTTAFGAPLADTYRIEASVLSTQRPAPAGAMLETRLEARAVNPGVSGAPVRCASTGRLEELIARAVERRLQP